MENININDALQQFPKEAQLVGQPISFCVGTKKNGTDGETEQQQVGTVVAFYWKTDELCVEVAGLEDAAFWVLGCQEIQYKLLSENDDKSAMNEKEMRLQKAAQNDAVGRRIKAYSTKAGRYFKGTILSFNQDNGRHLIRFDRGNVEKQLNLQTRNWRYIDLNYHLETCFMSLETSKYVGVRRSGEAEWMAYEKQAGFSTFIGKAKTEKEAALMHDFYAKCDKEKGIVNFPDEQAIAPPVTNLQKRKTATAPESPEFGGESNTPHEKKKKTEPTQEAAETMEPTQEAAETMEPTIQTMTAIPVSRRSRRKKRKSEPEEDVQATETPEPTNHATTEIPVSRRSRRKKRKTSKLEENEQSAENPEPKTQTPAESLVADAKQEKIQGAVKADAGQETQIEAKERVKDPNFEPFPDGTNFIKKFPDHGFFSGIVVSFDGEFYIVEYIDGDTEDLTHAELKEMIDAQPEFPEGKILIKKKKEKTEEGGLANDQPSKKRGRPSSVAKYPIGTVFKKVFEDIGTFEGRVICYQDKKYQVYYPEDQDQEVMTEAGLTRWLQACSMDEEDDEGDDDEKPQVKRRKRVLDKPPRRSSKSKQENSVVDAKPAANTIVKQEPQESAEESETSEGDAGSGSKVVYEGPPTKTLISSTWKEDWPEGWMERQRKRVNGETRKRLDSYWYPPVEGHDRLGCLRSLAEVRRYIQSQRQGNSHSKAFQDAKALGRRGPHSSAS